MSMHARVEKLEQRYGRGSQRDWDKWRAQEIKIADEFLVPYIRWCLRGGGKRLHALACHAEYRIQMEEHEKRRPPGASPFAAIKLSSAEDLRPFIRRHEGRPVEVHTRTRNADIGPAVEPAPEIQPAPMRAMSRGYVSPAGPVSKLPTGPTEEEQVAAINYFLEWGRTPGE
jgi:hypothetical protein